MWPARGEESDIILSHRRKGSKAKIKSYTLLFLMVVRRRTEPGEEMGGKGTDPQSRGL